MGVKDVLGALRDGGYGKNKPAKAESSEPTRSLTLTENETKILPEPDENGEVCLMVYGKIADGELQVSRVEAETTVEEEE